MNLFFHLRNSLYETPVEPGRTTGAMPTDGIINWNNEFIIVGDNNMANIEEVVLGIASAMEMENMWQWESNSSAAYSTDGISWNKTTAGSGLFV